ncbi:hypothetical protein PR002_g14468 [Phytophthora rubi]|uniref:Uncharacterized protein n=1 Tax=Phytophthora rubi TaxID=129364 RepID=A0A6A3L6G3_9STRA|nr:hypothetical protein PR002_g14468 [Phytophthora rubi]
MFVAPTPPKVAITPLPPTKDPAFVTPLPSTNIAKYATPLPLTKFIKLVPCRVACAQCSTAGVPARRRVRAGAVALRRRALV